MDRCASVSINTVCLASFAAKFHSPELMRRSQRQYCKALELVNNALLSPSNAVKDSTLVSIILLGLFETITGCRQRSLKSWTEHINGATAIIKMRGCNQFSSQLGVRLFLQMMTNIILSCIQREVPLPAEIIALRSVAAQHLNSQDPSWKVSEAVIEFTIWRAAYKNNIIWRPTEVVASALEIDRKLTRHATNMPVQWHFQTKYTDNHPDLVFNREYHIYYDNFVAHLWNSLRVCRVILNETIREHLLKGMLSSPPIFMAPGDTAQLQCSTDTLLNMRDDILASVPHHTGHVASIFAQVTTSAYAPGIFFSTNLDFNMPWENPTTTPITSEPTHQVASGGYFLLWPLFLAGSITVCTPEMRKWIIGRMEYIGNSMGVQAALTLARILQTKEPLWAWDGYGEPVIPEPLSSTVSKRGQRVLAQANGQYDVACGGDEHEPG